MRISSASLLAASATVMWTLTAKAQPDAPAAVAPQQTFVVPRLAEAPLIDGVLDHAWDAAGKFSAFYRFKTTEPARGRTEVYLAHDLTNLYIGVAAHHPPDYVPVANTPRSQRDRGIWAEDSIETFLAVEGAPDTYFQFIANPNGAMYEGRSGDASWNSPWACRAKAFDDRWEVEMAIPFEACGLTPSPGARVRFQIARNQQQPAEMSTWAPVRSQYFEGLAASSLLLGGDEVIRLHSVGGLPPPRLPGTVRNSGQGAALTVRVRDVQGTIVFSHSRKVPDGPFELRLEGVRTGARYAADLRVRTNSGKTRLTLPFEVNPPVDLRVLPRVLDGELDVLVSYFGRRIPSRYRLVLRRTEPRETVCTFELSGARRARKTLPLHSFPPGAYEAELTTSHGPTARHPCRQSFEVLAKPAWAGNSLGLSDEVLPPWTPLEVAGDSVRCWGREYQWNGLLPSQIVTQGAALLARPASLLVEANGASLAGTAADSRIVSAAPHKVIRESRIKGDLVELRTVSTVEYDGLVTVRLECAPSKPVTIDRLELAIPLRRAHVRLRSQRAIWGATLKEYEEKLKDFRAGGTLGASAWQGRPEPMWLGNETAGLAWCIEGEQGFALQDPNRAVELREDRETVLLTVRFVGRPVQVSQPLTYVFGLQATPVKPWPRAANVRYATLLVPSVRWFKGSRDFVEQPQRMDWLKDRGVRTLIEMSEWTPIHDSMVDYKSDWVRSFVSACRRRGLKAVLYFGFGLTTGTPEWQIMGEKPLRAPRGLPFGVPWTPGKLSYRACANSAYADYAVWRIDYMMKRYGIDGVYLDEFGAESCLSAEHGCGYVDAAGQRRAARPAFAFRRLMRRIYTVVKRNNPDGIVELHGRAPLPAMTFATHYLLGEQFMALKQADRPPLRSVVSLPMFRADFMGKPFGVPSTFLAYDRRPFLAAEALALGLIHDTPVRTGGFYTRRAYDNIALISSVWQAMERFGTSRAKFVGYWENRILTPARNDVKCSLWRRPDCRLLAVVTNLGESPRTCLKLDNDAAGLPAGAAPVAADPLSDTTLTIKTGAVELDVPREGFRMVLISGGK